MILPRLSSIEELEPLRCRRELNLHRRHLSESQWAMVAAKLANLENGQKASSANLPSIEPVTQAQAAKTLDVSTRSVTTAKKILNESPELAEKVSAGEITVHAAVSTT